MTTATPHIEDKGVDLAKRTVCLKLDFHSFGNSRKIDSGHIEVRDDSEKLDTKVDKGRIRASKTLLKSKELSAINSHFMMIKNYVWTQCLPFETSIHLLPIPLVPKIEKRLQSFKLELPELVNRFLKAYPDLCKQAAKELHSQYRASDYPDKKEMAKQFSFSWRYISFGVPDKLKGISAAMFEQEKEKAEQRMKEAVQEIQLVMRETMQQLVQHMSDKLKTDKDGKPMVFRKATVSKLLEFLNEFEFRNVTDDAELQKMVNKAKSLLEGVDPEQLRDLGDVRKKVAKEIDAMAKQLGTMTTRAARRFRED